MSHHNSASWRGFALGAMGGIAGLLAMRVYWASIKRVTGFDPRKTGHDMEGDTPHQLDDISLIGQHHKKDESSTAAIGRIAYETIMGRTPDQQTRSALSYGVHWLISLSIAGLYGALRHEESTPDLLGGALLGTGLWALGDEGLMPLLGLTDGPTAYSLDLHAHGLGAHLAYGLATSSTTQLLDDLL